MLQIAIELADDADQVCAFVVLALGMTSLNLNLNLKQHASVYTTLDTSMCIIHRTATAAPCKGNHLPMSTHNGQTK